MSSLRRGTPSVTFLAETPAKWKVFKVICVAGSPMDCAATVPMPSPGGASATLKRDSTSPMTQLNAAGDELELAHDPSWRSASSGRARRRESSSFSAPRWRARRGRARRRGRWSMDLTLVDDVHRLELLAAAAPARRAHVLHLPVVLLRVPDDPLEVHRQVHARVTLVHRR